MTDEDFEKIRAVMREVIAPLEADVSGIKAVQAEQARDIAPLRQDVIQIRNSLVQLEGDIAEIKAVQAQHTRDIALLRQDVIQIRNSLGMMEDRIEIMIGVSIRLDGTAQEVSGIRRMLDHLDRRVRMLEDQTPATTP